MGLPGDPGPRAHDDADMGLHHQDRGHRPSLQNRWRVAWLVLRRRRHRRPCRGSGTQGRAGRQCLFGFCRRFRHGRVRHRRGRHVHLRPWRLRPDGGRSGPRHPDPETVGGRRCRDVDHLAGRHRMLDTPRRRLWRCVRWAGRDRADPSSASASTAFATTARTVGSSACAEFRRCQDRSRSPACRLRA
jgi:hypothetical protein